MTNPVKHAAPNTIAGDGERSLHHRRLRYWQPYDEVRIRIVPRYKTSGMSGDEWRQHAQIDFYFKGEIVHEDGARDVETAIMRLGHIFLDSTCPIPTRVIEIERTKCDQPSCQNDAVARFMINRQTADDGSWLDPSEKEWTDWYRQFCRVHLRRGDCGREDNDDNYTPLDGVTADESTNTQESPSACVTVSLDSIDDLPAAIESVRREVES